MKKNLHSKTLILVIGFFLLTSCFAENGNPNDEIPLSNESKAELAKFKAAIRRNELKIDSINSLLNKKYEYPIKISLKFKDRFCFEFFPEIPYYGMTDGHNAFIYSLHRNDIHEVTLFYEGENNYTLIGDWAFEKVKVNLYKNDKFKSLFDAYVDYIYEKYKNSDILKKNYSYRDDYDENGFYYPRPR